MHHPLRWIGSLIGAAGVAFSITLLSQSMRSVQAVGGFCASGGPYEIRQPCPKGLGGTFPLAIIGGLIFLAVFAACTSDRGRTCTLLAWPALFLTLGWNFLDYGTKGGQAGGAGFLVCGVVFVIMGAAPLVWVVPRMLKAFLGQDVDDSGSPRLAPTEAAGSPTFTPFTQPTPWSAPSAAWSTVAPGTSTAPVAAPSTTVTSSPVTASAGTGDLATELERLASLHRRGELTDAEYETAKQQALHRAGGPA